MKPGRPEVVEHALDSLDTLWALPWVKSFDSRNCLAFANVKFSAGTKGVLSIEFDASDWQSYPGRVGNTRFRCEVTHTPRGPEDEFEHLICRLMPSITMPTVWFNNYTVDKLGLLVQQVQDYLRSSPVFISAFGDQMNLPG